MTVKELIAKLIEMDPEAAVHFTYDYDDQSKVMKHLRRSYGWNTRPATLVQRVEEGEVIHSSSSMTRVVKDGSGDVVVLIS